jgi:tetratricopeptide (TPR) repeat protein
MGGPSLSTAGALSGLPAAPPLSQVNPDPSRRPVRLSNELAMEKARQVILFGDEKLKNQQWLQAYVNYRNAVLISDDLADAHLRLSIASLALNRFPEAAVEFKRALFIDPTAARPDETLTTILGPDSRTVRAEVTRSVAMWAREDLRDQDRLFLLGAVLHLDGDKRAPEILEAAYRLTGSGDHLLALMSSPTQSPSVSVPPPVPNPPEMQTLPELHQRPLALH